MTSLAGVGTLSGCNLLQTETEESGTEGGSDLPRERTPSAIVWGDSDGTVHVLPQGGEERTSDDPTEAIQSALDSETGGSDQRWVVEVDGAFEISSGIEVPSGSVLDLRSAVLAATGDHAVLSLRDVSDAAVVGGILDGSGQPEGSEYRSVLALNRAKRVTVTGTEVRNGGYYGVNVYQCNNCTFHDVRAHHNQFTGIHPGTDEEGWGLDNSFVGCSAHDNGNNGISDRGTTVPQNLHNSYLNCYGWNNSGNGLLFGNGTDSGGMNTTHHVVECRSFENDDDGIQIDNANAAITNPSAEENGASGILLRNAGDVTILNPSVRNNDGNGIEMRTENESVRPHVVVYGGTSTGNSDNLSVQSANQDTHIAFRDVDARGATDENVSFENRPPNNVTIDNVVGFRTEASGTKSREPGDSRSFEWEHGLATSPETISVQPKNAVSMGDFRVDADENTVTVTYAEPPASGDGGELTWWWRAAAF